MALGVWSGISGIAVALGPLVGGAVTQLASWHWIFWINVPIGLVLVPLAARPPGRELRRGQPPGPAGLALGSTGLFGIVFGLVRAQSLGWGSTEVIVSLAAGAVLVVAFVIHELRTRRADAADELLRQARASPSPTWSRWRCTSGCSARSSS